MSYTSHAQHIVYTVTFQFGMSQVLSRRGVGRRTSSVRGWKRSSRHTELNVVLAFPEGGVQNLAELVIDKTIRHLKYPSFLAAWRPRGLNDEI
jgi:hypothetical protein